MSRRTAAWLVWSMLALTVLFDVFGCLLLVLNAHSPSVSTWYTLAVLPFTVVGVVIASQRPQDLIGWMFCVIGLAYSL